jgi:RimJ/RimL family protein N-acetyltransferase
VIALRPARDGDLDPIGRLHHRSRITAYSGFLPAPALAFGSPDSLAEWWAERWTWERHDHRMTVAADGPRIVGFSYLGPDASPGVMILHAIHADPEYVGHGVGKRLMMDALPHLGDRAVLWVLAGNDRARRFYEKGGWRFDGSTRVEHWGGVPVEQLRYAWPGGRERATE